MAKTAKSNHHHELSELVPLRCSPIGASSHSTVPLTVVPGREVVRVSVTSVVLEGLALLRLRVVEVSVGGAGTARDSLVVGEGAGVRCNGMILIESISVLLANVL